MARSKKTKAVKKPAKKKAVKKAKAAPKAKKTPKKAAKKTVVKASAAMIEDVVAEAAGPDVVQLVKVLRNKANVSEFTLAEKIKCEINQTRNMLYRLYENNLVTFIRKKDKKKGWYIYYWTFNEPRVKEIYLNLKKQKLAKLHDRLDRAPVSSRPRYWNWAEEILSISTIGGRS